MRAGAWSPARSSPGGLWRLVDGGSRGGRARRLRHRCRARRRSRPFAGAELLQVVGLVEAVEDAERTCGVALGAADDDPVWAFGLDCHLVACPQAGLLEGLDR